jgi:hypothetical protein
MAWSFDIGWQKKNDLEPNHSGTKARYHHFEENHFASEKMYKQHHHHQGSGRNMSKLENRSQNQQNEKRKTKTNELYMEGLDWVK